MERSLFSIIFILSGLIALMNPPENPKESSKDDKNVSKYWKYYIHLIKLSFYCHQMVKNRKIIGAKWCVEREYVE